MIIFVSVSIGAIMLIKLETPQSKPDKNEEAPEKETGLDRYISTHM